MVSCICVDNNTILVVLKYRKRVQFKVNIFAGVKGRVKCIRLLFDDDSTSRQEKR